eukprot:TRINITY_DN42967_c0_g1_i1.p1 TRINITY_DN42967_c0_g1~~TRINITY_DN42967_c0_g1_i1.p1  ORF type:complete len:562 (-),score=101.94 TRINITY_DN42967_c0_g1_i1:155-1750(-)
MRSRHTVLSYVATGIAVWLLRREPLKQHLPKYRALQSTASVPLFMRGRNRKLSCCLLHACGMSASRTPGPDEQAYTQELQSLFEAACELDAAGDAEAAAEVYRKVVTLAPSCKEAWLNLGLLHAENGSYEVALQAYDRALAADHTFDDAHYNKGLAFDDMGELEHALESFQMARRCTSSKKRKADYWYASGLSVHELDRAKAYRHYDKATKLNPRFLDAWVNRGLVLSELGDYDEATRSHKRAIDLSKGKDPGVWYNLAVNHAAANDIGLAEESLSKAMSVSRHEVLAVVQNFKPGGTALEERRAQEQEFAMANLHRLPPNTSEQASWHLAVQLVSCIRQMEADPSWILKRMVSAGRFGGETAYGTTWLDAWVDMVHACHLHAAETGCVSMVVFGSSLGMQCFLGRLLLGYSSCVGYDLLESEVAASRDIASRFDISAVEFHCQNALEADIGSAGLLWLNAYAWSPESKELLCAKLLSEAARAAIVVSYEALPDCTAGDRGRWLELEHTCALETSWDADLEAYEYRVRDMV